MALLFLTFFLTLAVISGTAAAIAQPSSLTITKVEPPNWWIGLPNPMLLIVGEGLTDAKVTADAPDVRVARIENGLNGKYLFVWLEITKAAKPGRVRLSVASPTGKKQIEFPLQRRNPAGMSFAANGGFNGFNSDDVLYLIMPDRFADGDPSNNFPESGTYDRSKPRAYHGGDLRGIQQRLPYLKDLGITTLWINPIYNNDDRKGQDYHGYGAVDFYSVEEHLGTLKDYQSLVRAAHELGLKVILDIVPNHAGPTHPWVNDPPSPTWLHGTKQKHLAAHSPFGPLTDPHSAPREWRDVLEGWFANVLPDLNTEDPWTAQYLRQNAIWWAETGSLDGFRIDTFPYVDRRFWHDFHAELHHEYPRFTTVGEAWNADPTVTSFFVGGKVTAGIDTGVDTLFDFPLLFAIRDVILKGALPQKLEDVLRYDWLFPHPENLVTFIGNHDTRRFVGEQGATVPELKLAFSLLATMRGIPQIYSGDEIGMPGGDDPDNRRDFPGGFPGDTQNAFTAEGRTPEQQQIFNHVRSLLKLRREHPALRHGKLFHIASDDQTYVFERESSSFSAGFTNERAEHLLVVMNSSRQQRHLRLEIADTPISTTQTIKPLFSAVNAELKEGKIELDIAPQSLSIYILECGCDL